MRVLVVEDQPQIAAAIEHGLQQEGFTVDIASTAADGESKAVSEPYDVVLLDVMLPDGDGIEVCRNLRKLGVKSRIMMLTALNTTEAKVNGLDSGADDYLVKPFDFDELTARIRAINRRSDAPETRHLQYDDLDLDLYSRTATRHGRQATLSNKEFSVLECLMRNAEREVTRAEVCRHVWGEKPDFTSNLVDVYISSLRKKIDADHDRELIHTVKGVGYRLGGN